MKSVITTLGLVAGVVAQSSCPLLPVTTVQVQPIYYSEVIPYYTVIDPFHNGKNITVTHAPSTVVTTDYLTTTILPGSTTQSGSTSGSSASSTSVSTASISSTITSALTSTTPTITSTPSFTNTTTTYSTVPISTVTDCALNTTSGTNQQQIAAAIDDWRSDVVFVNNFLETAGNLTDFNQIRHNAENVYAKAFDEPCQFQTLQNAVVSGGKGNDTQYLCAKNNLAGIFGSGVLEKLIDIIEDPTVLNARAADINFARCCRVLPDVNILFAKANGIFNGTEPQPKATDAPKPSTCDNVDCSTDPNASNCN